MGDNVILSYFYLAAEKYKYHEHSKDIFFKCLMKIASWLGKGPEAAVLLQGRTGRWVLEGRQMLRVNRRGEGWLHASQKSISATTSSEVQVKLSPSLKQDKYKSNFI